MGTTANNISLRILSVILPLYGLLIIQANASAQTAPLRAAEIVCAIPEPQAYHRATLRYRSRDGQRVIARTSLRRLPRSTRVSLYDLIRFVPLEGTLRVSIHGLTRSVYYPVCRLKSRPYPASNWRRLKILPPRKSRQGDSTPIPFPTASAPTITPVETPTLSPSPSTSPRVSPTHTAAPSQTVTPFPTATNTATPTRTATRTSTAGATATSTATPTRTPTRTATRTATMTSTPTRTPVSPGGGSIHSYTEEFNNESGIASHSANITVAGGSVGINTDTGAWQSNSSTVLMLHMNGSLLDSSGNGNHGQCVEPTCPVAEAEGVYGGQYRFNNDLVTIPLSSSLNSIDATGEFTIAFWIEPTDDESQTIFETPRITALRYQDFLIVYLFPNAGCATPGCNPQANPIPLSFNWLNMPKDRKTLIVLTYKRQGANAQFTAYANGGIDPIQDVARQTIPNMALSASGSLNIGGPGSLGFRNTGLDEFLILNQALSDEQVLNLSGSSFSGSLVSNAVIGTQQIQSVEANWNPHSVSVTVEISTTDGDTWCPIENGGYIGFGNSEGSGCTQPLHSRFIYRVIFAGPIPEIAERMDSISFRWTYAVPACRDGIDNDGDGFQDYPADFGCVSGSDFDESDTVGSLTLGTNLNALSDFDPSLVFVDAFKTNRAWLAVKNGQDTWGPLNTAIVPLVANGYPAVAIPHVVGGDSYQLSTLMLREIDDKFPAGQYRLHCSGTGRIRLKFSGTDGVYTCPAATPHAVNVTPTGGGVYLILEQSSASDPVRNIRFMLPAVSIPGELPYDGMPSNARSQFNPQFLSRIRGFDTLRFMDWQLTNSSNLVRWQDRQTPNSVSQSWIPMREIDIVSVTGPVPAPSHSIVGNCDLSPCSMITVQTSQPHGLLTGQTITIVDSQASGLDAVWRWPYVDADTGNPYTFHIRVQPEFRLSASTWGRMRFELAPGAALEHQIDLVNTLGANPWFNIPHLANDDFVRQFARMVATQVDFLNFPDRKVYVEYSNEAPWQAGFFAQGNWLHAMAKIDPTFVAEVGMNGGGVAYYAHRAVQVHDIFKQEFIAAGVGLHRLVRVLGGQAGTPGIGEQEFAHLVQYHGHSASNKIVDAYSPAAYFGTDPDTPNFDVVDMVTQGASLQTIVDRTFEAIELNLDRLAGSMMANKVVADRYHVDMVAYEAGQHLVPILEPLPPNQPAAVERLTLAWSIVQTDPRMYVMYNRLFQIWKNAGGKLLNHFSSLGTHSKWGYWGALQYITQPAEDAPKYCAIRERIEGYGGADSCHTRLRQPQY